MRRFHEIFAKRKKRKLTVRVNFCNFHSVLACLLRLFRRETFSFGTTQASSWILACWKKNYDHWLRTCHYPHCRGEERLSWRKQDLWTHVYFCSVENFFHNWPIWCVSTLRKPFRLKVVRHFESCPTLSKPYLPWPTSREWAPLWHQVWKTNEKNSFYKTTMLLQCRILHEFSLVGFFYFLFIVTLLVDFFYSMCNAFWLLFEVTFYCYLFSFLTSTRHHYFTTSTSSL